MIEIKKETEYFLEPDTFIYFRHIKHQETTQHQDGISPLNIVTFWFTMVAFLLVYKAQYCPITNHPSMILTIGRLLSS